MILPPKQLIWRLLIWSGLFAYAVWRMRQPAPSEPAEPAEPPPAAAIDHHLFSSAAPADPAAPDVMDVPAAMSAMDAAIQAAATCGAKGTLTVTLGSGGLTEASFDGEGDRACLTTGVRAQKWPAAKQAFELDRALGER